MNFWHSLGTTQNEFSANTFYLTGNIELSIIPVPGYECAYDGTTPIYDRMTMTGWTRTINNSTQERWQGTTKFWTGDTQVAYTENGQIDLNKTTKLYTLLGDWNTGYFNILPI